MPIVVTILLTIIWAILLAYIFILMMRIVLGWFAPESLGRAWDLLTASTDPYLKLFARIRFLRSNLFDFSPIAAILVLVVALDLVSRLRDYMSVTLGTFLASVTSAAWSGVRFLLLFFLLVGILRTIPLVFRSPEAQASGKSWTCSCSPSLPGSRERSDWVSGPVILSICFLPSDFCWSPGSSEGGS